MKNIFLLCVCMMSMSCSRIEHASQSSPLFRGFMIDAARDVETPDYYRRLVDFLSERECNVILFRLTDDEGCAVRFASHPELVTHPNAFAPAQIRELVDYARSRNIEMIPEVESFGHTKYITSSKAYEYLRDYPDDKYWMNAICPVHDTTLKLMNDLFGEAAALFPSQYFHIGCDEIDWGASSWSKEALKTRSKDDIVAGYINALNGIVRSLGKKTIIWGDMVIHAKDSTILSKLDRDIVIMDWNYWETDDRIIDSTARAVLDRGFQLIGAPAVTWFAWGPRIGAYQIENLSCLSRVYTAIKQPGNLGVIITNWGPKRYIQNSQWDEYAVAANILSDPFAFDFSKSMEKFNKSFYGAPWNKEWELFYREAYDCMPAHLYVTEKRVPAVFHGVPVMRIMPWAAKWYVEENIMTRDSLLENRFAKLAQKGREFEKSVSRNKQDYHEFMASLEWTAYVIDRDNAMWKLCKQCGSKQELKESLAMLAASDSAWVARLGTFWQKGRTAPLDSTHLWSFPLAARYSRQLSDNPSELIALIARSGRRLSD